MSGLMTPVALTVRVLLAPGLFIVGRAAGRRRDEIADCMVTTMTMTMTMESGVYFSYNNFGLNEGIGE